MGARRKIGRTITLGLALVAVAGCASSGGGSGGGGGGSSTLTTEELSQTNEPNLYNAVRRLRPNWLRTRGSGGEVQLFVNGTPTGTVAQLSSIPIESVVEVRYYSPSEAGFTFGTVGGNVGVVAVSTRR